MNPHDVACLLKEFFRSLPEPLMTVELFAPFLATTSESKSPNSNHYRGSLLVTGSCMAL